MRTLRGLALLVGVGLALAVTAGPAGAHASFVSASPRPGTGLPQAPGQVVMRFSEPLVRDLSRMEVLGPDGLAATTGPTRPVEGDAKAMRRGLGLLAPGVYTVRWTTVSPLDGHTLKGSYKFAIGSATLGKQSVGADPVSSEGWLGLAGRFVALAGLLVWAGSAGLGRVAVRAGVPRATRVGLARAGPALACVGTAAALVSSALVATESLAAVQAVALGSGSGLLRTAVVAGGAVAVLAGLRSGRAYTLLAAGAVLAEAGSGHAAANPWPALAVPSFALHLGAAGVWVYAVVAAAASPGRRRGVLAAFFPYAVAAAGIVGLTGAGNAALELTGPADLLATGYGRVVALKAAAFAGMAGLGLAHHLLRRRAPHRTAALRRAVGGEAGVLAGAVILATVLVGFPNPPRDEQAVAAEATASDRLVAFLDRPAVSVAEEAGPYVVGISLAPPRPGRVTVRLDVLGVEAGDALRDARVRARRPETPAVEARLKPCGQGCFQGRMDLAGAGRWTLEVAMASNRAPLEVATTLDLPAPEASGSLERTIAAMEALSSTRAREELSGSEHGQKIISAYTFRAPDRMRWEVTAGGSTRIGIGRRGYLRRDPQAPWKAYRWSGEGFSWPEGFYRDFWGGTPAAVRHLGQQTVKGAPTEVVAFATPGFPAWFRLWADRKTGRILRLEMLAEGHFMYQDYLASNGPVKVRPPPACAGVTPQGTDRVTCPGPQARQG